jgi:YidC/Oxa1 family membrane protein insertase
MDSRRLILFIALSLGLMLLWDKYVAPKTPDAQVATSQTTPATTNNANAVVEGANGLVDGDTINVTACRVGVFVSCVLTASSRY